MAGDAGQVFDGAYMALMDIPVIEWPIPDGAMRVAPGSDAVVWKTSPEHCGEL